jgi:hypothetical protein
MGASDNESGRKKAQEAQTMAKVKKDKQRTAFERIRSANDGEG